MDLLPPDELQFLSLKQIISESTKIPKASPRTFHLITLTLIFPLSFAILGHSLFTHPIIVKIETHSANTSSAHEWTTLFVYQFIYLIFLFAFSLLSTAAVVFTVASLYTSKAVSFMSTMNAIPRVFKRVFVTYLWVSGLMVGYYIMFLGVVLLLVLAIDTDNVVLLVLSMIAVLVLFLVVHVYVTALWHMASVVSVLEPLYGFAAMKKSRELLRGKVRDAGMLVLMYVAICGLIEGFFGTFVVRGGLHHGVMFRVMMGGGLVGVLVIVNLVGLLVQSVFYYVLKSYHHQGIDKSALYEHLGEYLGEYVPLKSSVQMENLDV